MAEYTLPGCPQYSELHFEQPRFEIKSINNVTRYKNSGFPRWRATVTYPPMLYRDADELDMILMNMRIGDHRIRYTLPTHGAPKAAITGTPLVNGANQTGTAINIDGFTGTISAGDFLRIGNQLVRASANRVNSGALSVLPAIRVAPADNSVVVVNTPYVLMVLADVETGVIVSRPGWTTRTINLVEYL